MIRTKTELVNTIGQLRLSCMSGSGIKVSVQVCIPERYKSPEIKIDYDDMEVMLRFFACGMMGILIHYADNPQLSEEKLIEQIRRILTGRLVPGKQDPPQ